METTVKKREWVKNAAILLLAALLLLTFFSNTIMNRTLPEVATTAVRSGTITAQIRGTGAVSAAKSYEVMVDQSRKVRSVLIRQGQEVKAGDVLFILDTDSEELQSAEERLRELNKQYQTAQINASSSGVEWARQDLAEAQAERDKYQYDEEELAQAERDLDAAKDSLKQTAAKLREFNVYDTVDEELLVSLQKDIKTRSKAFDEAKRNLDAASVLYRKRWDWIRTRAEQEIKKTDEYSACLDFEKSAYVTRMLPAYMEFVMQQIENSYIIVEGSYEGGRYVGNSYETARQNDDSIVAQYKEAYTKTLEAQKEYDKASEDYYSQDTRITTVIAEAEQQLNGYTEAKEQLDGLKERKEKYTAAVDGIRSAERELDELDRSARLSAVEVADLAVQLIAQQQKVDELRAGAEGTEIKAEVGGTIGSVSITAGNTTTPKTAMATIDLADMGYQLSFSVTSEQARRVHVGDKADAANLYWGSQIDAELVSIKSDPKDPQNSKILNFEVRGDVSPGSNLTLTIGERGVEYDAIVPKGAVRPDSTNGDYVLVITSKSSPLGNRYIATRVPVEVLARDDKNAAITGAVEQGDYVVTTSSAPIDNGKRVRLADTQS
ncbi:MAG: HlyD family efflux transporter periplasmic adaptor subunit [Oscillospiraceae bacterium]|nr:HlyD family efflux transporter periplasmic adaptor subunit [Oscillospiraceae bacterium]